MIRTEKRKHIFLMLLLTATVLTGCVGGNPTLEQALKKTAEYEQETVTSPTSDSLGGEWTVSKSIIRKSISLLKNTQKIL